MNNPHELIVKSHGTYPFLIKHQIGWCGKDSDGSISGGLPFFISKSYVEYTHNAGGIIPIDDVIKLRNFLTVWIDEFADKKGTYNDETKTS